MKRREYTNDFKVQVLDDVKAIGNVSKVAEKHKITRQSIYDWKAQESEIRGDVEVGDALVVLRDAGEITETAFQNLRRHKSALEALGTLEERKKALAEKVEVNLLRVVDLLEDSEFLQATPPKDLAKIMIDLNTVKKDLYNEPDLVIENRNNMIYMVLHVLKDNFGFSEAELREFVRIIELKESI